MSLTIVLLLVFAAVLARTLQLDYKQRGRSRCEACKSRIKKVGLIYATTCRRCGRVQAWARSTQ